VPFVADNCENFVEVLSVLEKGGYVKLNKGQAYRRLQKQEKQVEESKELKENENDEPTKPTKSNKPKKIKEKKKVTKSNKSKKSKKNENDEPEKHPQKTIKRKSKRSSKTKKLKTPKIPKNTKLTGVSVVDKLFADVDPKFYQEIQQKWGEYKENVDYDLAKTIKSIQDEENLLTTSEIHLGYDCLTVNTRIFYFYLINMCMINICFEYVFS
jgi:hypothetical protein